MRIKHFFEWHSLLMKAVNQFIGLNLVERCGTVILIISIGDGLIKLRVFDFHFLGGLVARVQSSFVSETLGSSNLSEIELALPVNRK